MHQLVEAVASLVGGSEAPGEGDEEEVAIREDEQEINRVFRETLWTQETHTVRKEGIQKLSPNDLWMETPEKDWKHDFW